MWPSFEIYTTNYKKNIKGTPNFTRDKKITHEFKKTVEKLDLLFLKKNTKTITRN